MHRWQQEKNASGRRIRAVPDDCGNGYSPTCQDRTEPSRLQRGERQSRARVDGHDVELWQLLRKIESFKKKPGCVVP
jgi:hypothetical protein